MTDFAGLRVLVVEDEAPVALLIEDMLLELGCEIVASAAEVRKASQLAGELHIDLALLDLNLNGQSALPVARILHERAIRFLFISGYGAAGVLEEFASCPTLAKPFTLADLQGRISLALDGGSDRM